MKLGRLEANRAGAGALLTGSVVQRPGLGITHGMVTLSLLQKSRHQQPHSASLKEFQLYTHGVAHSGLQDLTGEL